MNKLEAKNLVFNTFEKTFDESRFTYFVRNLLNNFDESKSQTWAGNYIPESFRNSIKYYKRIGQYIAKDKNVLDVLIVNVKRDNTLERARTLQRNFIARHLKQRNHEAALVAFYTEGYDDWRFSLVKMDFNLNKNKIEIELSPAKRYSFLVGANERSHTAQSQFQKILTEIPNPTLNELEQAFNIETVTREFFLEYRNLFIHTKLELDKVLKNDAKLKTEFDFKNVNSVDFSKKLLGQIIFLYFLQKKGWFGVERDSDWGTGSKKFLRELLDRKHGDYKNFFNDILEPLFYEALRYDRQDYYYSRFNCKIPFLNGGLFDPINNYDWVHTDIILPNNLFSNKNKTSQGDIGDGIFDIFDRYNFTVIEDEPLEKEVAIDPELLGKAYEKFNAIRPDNFAEYIKVLKSGKKGEENKFNKQYGVYYTPREIVHYMCRESLINYLASEFSDKTDAYQKVSTEQLDAFGNTTRKGQLSLEVEYKPNPFIPKEDIETLINYGELLGENEAVVESKGKETGTYYHKLSESIRKNAKLVDEKLADILICDPAVGSGAFPVGMMHEIVGARNLLSIFIKDSGRTIYNFKRECIEKSLYGVDIDSGAVEIAKLRLWLSLVVDEDDFKEIKPLPNLDYKIVCGDSLLNYPYKPIGLDEIEKLKQDFIVETNPNKKNELRGKIDSSIYGLFKNSEKSLGYKVTMDFKINFSEVFHKKSGFDIVIANPPYISAWSMEVNDEDMRRQIKKSLGNNKILVGHWDLYIAFVVIAYQILRIKGTITYITPNPILKEKYAAATRIFLLSDMALLSILEFNEINVFENVSRRTSVFIASKEICANDYSVKIYSNTIESGITLTNEVKKSQWLSQPKVLFTIRSSSFNNKLLEKIDSQSSRVGNYFYVNYGAQVSSKEKGRFGKSEVVGKKSKGNAKEFYEGKDVHRWQLKYRGLWLDYRKDEIYGPRFPALFENNKIVIRKVSDRGHILAATLDSSKRYTDDGNVLAVPYSCLKDSNLKISFDGYEIIDKKINPEFTLAILLSKLQSFYFKNRFATESLQGLTSHTYPTSVRSLVLKIPSIKIQNIFASIVTNILRLKKQNPQANTQHLEDKIDIMVYKLYNLTYEEVKIIDPEIEKIISEKDYEKFE